MGKQYNEQRIIGSAAVDGNGNDPTVTPWSYAAAASGIVSSTADVALKAAGGSGVVNYLTGLTIDHDTLGAVTEFVVKSGSTVIYRGKLQTAAAEGRSAIQFWPPLKTASNAALNFALVTSVTGGVYVNAQGYSGS